MNIEDVKKECYFVANQQDRVFAQKMARSLNIAIEAMQIELSKFRIPDEDSQVIYNAIKDIEEQFSKPF